MTTLWSTGCEKKWSMQCLGGASKTKSVSSLSLSFFMLDKLVAAMSWKPYLDAWTPGKLKEQSCTISLDFYGTEISFKLFKPLFVLVLSIILPQSNWGIKGYSVFGKAQQLFHFPVIFFFLFTQDLLYCCPSHSSFQPKSTPALSSPNGEFLLPILHIALFPSPTPFESLAETEPTYTK